MRDMHHTTCMISWLKLSRVRRERGTTCAAVPLLPWKYPPQNNLEHAHSEPTGNSETQPQSMFLDCTDTERTYKSQQHRQNCWWIEPSTLEERSWGATHRVVTRGKLFWRSAVMIHAAQVLMDCCVHRCISLQEKDLFQQITSALSQKQKIWGNCPLKMYPKKTRAKKELIYQKSQSKLMQKQWSIYI